MNKTVLLVDDEEHMLRLLQFALKSVPVTTRALRSGAEALAVLAGQPADLVLLDYSMPGMNGVETLRRIRDMDGGGGVKVVMLTARDQTAIRQEAAGLNVEAFLTKPFSPSDLARRVLALTAGGPPSGPESV